MHTFCLVSHFQAWNFNCEDLLYGEIAQCHKSRGALNLTIGPSFTISCLLLSQEKETEEEEEEEEDEEADSFDLVITVSDPAKVGDGMGAYIAYSVTTKTSMPAFKSPETSVKRRFSDFLGLGHRLSEKYTLKGRIVPPAPEKSVVGKVLVRVSGG